MMMMMMMMLMMLMHRRWSLFTLCLLVCQVIVTVGDSGLCCCVHCLLIAINSLCWLIM